MISKEKVEYKKVSNRHVKVFPVAHYFSWRENFTLTSSLLLQTSKKKKNLGEKREEVKV